MTVTIGEFGRATHPTGKHDVPDSQRAENHQADTPPAIWPVPHGLGFRAFLRGLAITTVCVAIAALIVFGDYFVRLPEGWSRGLNVAALALVIAVVIAWAWRETR